MLCWSHGNKQTLSCLQNTMPKMDDGERRPLTSARKVTSQILQPSFLSRKYTETWKITMRSDIRKTRAKPQISDNDKESENSYEGGGGERGSILKLAVEHCRLHGRQKSRAGHQHIHQACSYALRILKESIKIICLTTLTRARHGSHSACAIQNSYRFSSFELVTNLAHDVSPDNACYQNTTSLTPQMRGHRCRVQTFFLLSLEQNGNCSMTNCNSAEKKRKDNLHWSSSSVWWWDCKVLRW